MSGHQHGRHSIEGAGVASIPQRSSSYPVELTGVTKCYGDTVALRSVDLVIGRQDRVVITGPSGSGKSTLLRVITGKEMPDKGTVKRFGETLIGPSVSYRNERAYKTAVAEADRRHRIGILNSSAQLVGSHSPWWNVTCAARSNRVPLDRTHTYTVLNGLDLSDDLLNRDGSYGLSRGEQARVALARVLLAKPELVIFDEPLANLDGERRKETVHLLGSVCVETNTTLVMVTHDADAIDAVEGFATRRIVVDRGELTEQGFWPSCDINCS